MAGRVRKSNFFEIVLLFVGVGVIILGFHFINQVYRTEGVLNWEMIQSVFLWLLLIVMVVLLATEEDVKEELSIILKETMEETRLAKEETRLLKEETKFLKTDTALLKNINSELLQEIKLMRKIMEDADIAIKRKK